MSEDNLPLHIVYLRDGRVLLTMKRYGGWRELQDEYEGYMSSLGPWTAAEVIEFLDGEYPDLRPPEARVNAFVRGDAASVEL